MMINDLVVLLHIRTLPLCSTTHFPLGGIFIFSHKKKNIYPLKLTKVISCPQDDDDSILTLQSLLHILFVKDISYHHPGGFMVSGQPGRIPHQHGHVITWDKNIQRDIK